mmetsp:Transcript_29002/g.45457  ORF Transcript_29002/g.45457 Transcript_29002/m.45457 type:complete len:145 (+) Transcript_29002:499-933(+)
MTHVSIKYLHFQSIFVDLVILFCGELQPGLYTEEKLQVLLWQGQRVESYTSTQSREPAVSPVSLCDDPAASPSAAPSSTRTREVSGEAVMISLTGGVRSAESDCAQLKVEGLTWRGSGSEALRGRGAEGLRVGMRGRGAEGLRG